MANKKSRNNRTRDINIVRVLIGIVGIILAFLAVTNPEIRNAVIINLILLGLAYFGYSAKELKNNLPVYPRTITKILVTTGLAIVSVIAFYLITRLVPGLSLAYPSLPQSIGDSLKFFLVVVVAPFVEELAFRGFMLEFFLRITKSEQLALIIKAAIFSMFHLAAYIFGFYKLPDIATGLSAIGSNIGVFIVAFLFSYIVGLLILNVKLFKDNLLYAQELHIGLNLIAFSLAIGGII